MNGDGRKTLFVVALCSVYVGDFLLFLNSPVERADCGEFSKSRTSVGLRRKEEVEGGEGEGGSG
jgi:hypothetical protein